MLGSPAAVVGSNRMVLPPVFSGTVTVLVDHVVQAPVGSNDTAATVVPLTIRFAGRALVVPLANRTPSVAVPAAAGVTVNWA
jgi:hypothetical protein